MIINVGENLVANINYTKKEVSHDYVFTGVLEDGSSTCEDGVIITRTCVDCGYSYNERYTHHYSYITDRINMEEYGGVCGGYIAIYGCACGYSYSLNKDNLLCDEIGRFTTSDWVKDAITGGSSTSNGYDYYNVEAKEFICAVTHPTKCAFTFRYAIYYKKDADACRIRQYITLQVYNSQTDTWGEVATFVNNYSRAYHIYNSEEINSVDENGNTVRGTLYTCPDCGSYERYEDYYNENNQTIKRNHYWFNTLNNGENISRQELYEFEYDEYGNTIVQDQYCHYVRADGSEWWDRYHYTYDYSYQAPYGEGDYKYTREYTNSNGSQETYECAYTYLKNGEQTRHVVVYESYQYVDSWRRYDYTYITPDGCRRIRTYTDSSGGKNTTEEESHNQYWSTTKNPTCTQEGTQSLMCYYCSEIMDEQSINPFAHNWVKVSEDLYFCKSCGLQNSNGVTGSIVLEDLSRAYGNDENYVVGYYKMVNVKFVYYVSLILNQPMADGNNEILLDFANFIELQEVRAIAFSKKEVEELALALGYTADMYDVRFTLVPMGSDGSFDYAITFTDEEEYIFNITGPTAFTHFVGAGQTLHYTITPVETKTWIFTSYADGDTYAYLYDSEGNQLVANDDGAENNQFYISYTLEAGKTYRFDIRWYSSNNYGYIPVIISDTNVE